ncbi:hypothetical protein DEO23_13890 [Brachybacterium endophyticum]|uniref:Uncharacterized protein n=1 Tax=Brachybacterium endophyticum TaxID=2182385 RepID=A0A2U2RH22_9MICO|nr:hypothetical protein [Brachybacterium endophyticum]PWH05169.1 hypothetical protein DEO23_13890 [Brachybacterium endophyticum]
MRIFVPVTVDDAPVLRSGTTRLPLAADRIVWGVGDEARTDRPDVDLEELEYDALQDAVFSALQDVAPTERAVVLAGDLPDGALAGAGDEAGAFGLRLTSEETLRIVSAHATELDAAGAEADDTDPALLWFDAVELGAALDYASTAR